MKTLTRNVASNDVPKESQVSTASDHHPSETLTRHVAAHSGKVEVEVDVEKQCVGLLVETTASDEDREDLWPWDPERLGREGRGMLTGTSIFVPERSRVRVSARVRAAGTSLVASLKVPRGAAACGFDAKLICYVLNESGEVRKSRNTQLSPSYQRSLAEGLDEDFAGLMGFESISIDQRLMVRFARVPAGSVILPVIMVEAGAYVSDDSSLFAQTDLGGADCVRVSGWRTRVTPL